MPSVSIFFAAQYYETGEHFSEFTAFLRVYYRYRRGNPPIRGVLYLFRPSD
jgi:hypothetical protein